MKRRWGWLGVLLQLTQCGAPPAPQAAPNPSHDPAVPSAPPAWLSAASTQATAAPQGPPSGLGPLVAAPGGTRATLSNGLTLEVVAQPSQLVELSLVLPGGSASDGDYSGRAALSAAALQYVGATQTARAVPGAKLDVRTTPDATFVDLSVEAPYLTLALNGLATLLLHPSVSAVQFSALRSEAAQRALAGQNGR